MRQLEPVYKQIGDYEFAITPFPAFKAANISGELASTLSPLAGAFAPLIGAVMKSGDGKNGDSASVMDMDVTEAAKALSGCSAISGDRLEALMKKLLLGGNISVKYEEDGKQRTKRLDEDLANELFCGNVQDMYVLCVCVIQINYNGFFKRLAALSGTDEDETREPRKIV